MPSVASTDTPRAPITRVLCIPKDLEEGDHLYLPLPQDHFSVKNALDVMSGIANEIERVVGPKEPYEINMLGLRNSMPAALQPVITIGIARSDRLTKVLPHLDIPYLVHLSSHYPTSFSNAADRNPRPAEHTALQHEVPPMGSSCGLLADDRHSVTCGSYVHVSSMPKKLFILTAPLSTGPSVHVAKGNVVTQPSVADRQCLYDSEDRHWREVLKQDRDQSAAVAARREDMNKNFELGRTVASASGLQSPDKDRPMTAEDVQFESVVWDGSQTHRERNQTRACASNSWSILEVTRATTLVALSSTKRRWPFRGGSHAQSHLHALVPGLLVSKTGRTTGVTIGAVNGVKSLYRLPRDGPGVRRYDYPVVSRCGGGSFGLPGDAGAVVLVQQKEDVEDNQLVKNSRKPCALIVACSTRGHVSFVQDMESVVAGVKDAGLGHLSFIQVSS